MIRYCVLKLYCKARSRQTLKEMVRFILLLLLIIKMTLDKIFKKLFFIKKIKLRLYSKYNQ